MKLFRVLVLVGLLGVPCLGQTVQVDYSGSHSNNNGLYAASAFIGAVFIYGIFRLFHRRPFTFSRK